MASVYIVLRCKVAYVCYPTKCKLSQFRLEPTFLIRVQWGKEDVTFWDQVFLTRSSMVKEPHSHPETIYLTIQFEPTTLRLYEASTEPLYNTTSTIIEQLFVFTWSSCSSKLHLSKWWLWYVSFGILSMYSSYCSIDVCLSRMPLDSSLSLLLK